MIGGDDLTIGVWRDSCELAAHAPDSGPTGVWHDWVEFLFGGQSVGTSNAPKPAALVASVPQLFDAPLDPPGRLGIDGATEQAVSEP